MEMLYIMDRTTCGIAIPVLNERETILPFLETLSQTVPSVNSSENRYMPRITQIVFVDGGSNDGTQDIIKHTIHDHPEKWNGVDVTLIAQPANTALAYAEYLGIDALTTDYALKMDGDMQHNPAFIPNLLAEASSADLVIASRYLPGGGSSWAAIRGLISRIAKFESGFFVSNARRARDPLSGFFLISKHRVHVCAPHSSGYKLLLEILAINRDLVIKEVPYRIIQRTNGHSKIVSSIRRMLINFNRELIYSHKLSARTINK